MQINTQLTIKNIHSIKGTIIPTPNLIEKFVIWDIESNDYQYRVLITHNHNPKMVLKISRENAHYPSSLTKDVNSYICTLEHTYNYAIDTERWILETDDFKDKDTFIGIIGERVEKLIFKKVLKEMKEQQWTLNSNPTIPSLKTLYKTPTPDDYTPKESKPNLTHKIKKIMQGLGQIPDNILHNIQYYIRKIV